MRLLAAVAVALAVSGATAAAAHADVEYAGVAVRAGRPAGPSISLVRRDAQTIVGGRLYLALSCRGRRYPHVVVPLVGVFNGADFHVSGRRHPGRGAKLRYVLDGTFTADGATGKLRLYGCGGMTRDFVLRAVAAPGGVPVAPVPGSLFSGLSAQTVGDTRIPVTVGVRADGRMYALWWATMRCGAITLGMGNSTPATAVAPDGTFSRSERYTIRYSNGLRERYRVTFAGRFVAGGAVGSLRVRMRQHAKGHRFKPCDSGTQGWSAR